MPRLPKKNTSTPKRGWTAKSATPDKKIVPPKKRLTLQQRLKQKANLSKRPGRNRRFINAKEIRLIFRCSERKAWRVLKEIREKNGKSPHAQVTLEEFSKHWMLPPESVRDFLYSWTGK